MSAQDVDTILGTLEQRAPAIIRYRDSGGGLHDWNIWCLDNETVDDLRDHLHRTRPEAEFVSAEIQRPDGQELPDVLLKAARTAGSRIAIEKDGRVLYARDGYALERALAEGWTVKDPQPPGRETSGRG